MNSLRFILLIVGLLILAGIVVHYRYQHKPRRPMPRAERREPRLFPAADDDEVRSKPLVADDGRKETVPAGDMAPMIFPAVREPEAPATDDLAKPLGVTPILGGIGSEGVEKIVVLYLKARDERRINGVELLDAAVKTGLEFGERRIFHRLEEGSSEPVYSMANLIAPGDFDPAEWSRFSTPGVALFMVLPGTRPALDRWEGMHAAAERLAQLLDADLLDDTRCLVTRQRLAQLREEMRDFDRRHDLLRGAQ